MDTILLDEMNAKLQVNQTQLSGEIDQLAAISDAESPCVTRVLFTEKDVMGRDFVKKLASECGLQIREDALGNIFLTWEGAAPQKGKVATGSHTDAIPFSGKYDGVVGVLGAIEAVRALQRAGFQPDKSIEIIAFTSEEPTRFGIGCLGSRALCGSLGVQELLQFTDAEGVTLDQARKQAGYDGDLAGVVLAKEEYDAFVELHIEQGPELEKESLTIGAVTAIAAPATLRIAIEGEGGHAGACLMPNRKDALLPASEIALQVAHVAHASGPNAVATTGFFEVYPGAVNSIPSKVTMEIDIRDTDLNTRDRMVEEVVKATENICAKHKVKHTCTTLNADPPATCSKELVNTILAAAAAEKLPAKSMVSRAYHDSLFMAQLCPTSMIFVPSENGYSHRPEEYTSPSDLEKGVKVLAKVLAKLSKS